MNDLNDRFKKSAENFSLIPSDGIWKNIEAEIRGRERKKRFLIFFFIGVAILSTGIILFINPYDKQTEFQKSNPTVIEQKAQQQNNSTKSDYSEKENNVAQPVFAEVKNPDRINTASQNKLPTTFVSIRGSKNVSTPETQKTSDKNYSITDNSFKPDNGSLDIITISSAASASIHTDSTFAEADTLETAAGNDSLTIANSDFIPKDTLVEIKETIQTKDSISNWSIAIGIAPTLGFSSQHEKGDYQIISNYRDSSDKILLTWNYHLAINYRFMQRMEVYTGFGIINFEEELLSKQAVYHYDTSTIVVGPVPKIYVSREYFNINGDSTGTVKNKFSWIEIPIGFRYDFLPNHKFNISLQPEFSFNKLMSADGYIYNYQTLAYEKIKVSDLKSWMFSYGIGVSFQYSILKNLQIEFTPCYKNFEKSIYDDAYPLSQHLQQMEFRLNLRYLIK